MVRQARRSQTCIRHNCYGTASMCIVAYMVNADKELQDAYDYLAPGGSEIRLLSVIRGGGLAHCTLRPGGLSRAVTHRSVEEIWYGLSGEGELFRTTLGSLSRPKRYHLHWHSLSVPRGGYSAATDPLQSRAGLDGTRPSQYQAHGPISRRRFSRAFPWDSRGFHISGAFAFGAHTMDRNAVRDSRGEKGGPRLKLHGDVDTPQD